MSEKVTDIRFGGIKRLYGHQQFDWLQEAHFCVVGIGGVGSWTAEALARTGVGKITLIDLDDICATNVNRQIHALTGTIGQAKVDAMKARCELINPECQISVIDDFITLDNIQDLVKKNYKTRKEAASDAQTIINSRVQEYMNWRKSQSAFSVIKLYRETLILEE